MKDKLSLDLLQQQIRPHFLYNTLDNICSLAELNETETLIDLVMNLSSFYRSTLSNGKNEITIQEELNLTESYLHIMQIRYFNKFAFEIHCPPHLLHCKCLKLLLQPIVENSIYHGIKVVPYKGILKIFISEGENCILFTVIDNGIGLPENFKVSLNNDEEGSEKHFGIKNIQHRIELYYGPQYGLILQNAPGGGCICTIRIKKQEVPYL